ncbi:MAG: hypothetical protein CMK83_16055 [Pseudomonadales bacterium]|nr:hypothetical protein [Pseudomonadales bacterium]
MHCQPKATFNCLAKLIIVMLFAMLYLQNSHAAPAAELWPKWNRSNQSSVAVIDHSPWATLLKRYLQTSGSPVVTRFDYAAVTGQDKSRLDGYVEQLQQIPVLQFNKAEQLAYWINLYNAVTVKLILDHYPVESIRDIKFGFFSFGPWNEKLVEVAGEPLSLNDIEHRILRPIWQDNRIHYAVNCASVGCPNLAAEAYSAGNTEALLHQGAKDYVNHPRGVSFDDGDLVLSSIYDWYQTDFGNSEAGVVRHLLQYADPELAARLSGHAGDVHYRYDWALNSP